MKHYRSRVSTHAMLHVQELDQQRQRLMELRLNKPMPASVPALAISMPQVTPRSLLGVQQACL